jgi:hypothetical protein
MTKQPHEHYSAWDEAIRDLDSAVEAFRAAVGGVPGEKNEKDVAALANEVSRRKKAAFEAWETYVNAAGYGRI